MCASLARISATKHKSADSSKGGKLLSILILFIICRISKSLLIADCVGDSDSGSSGFVEQTIVVSAIASVMSSTVSDMDGKGSETSVLFVSPGMSTTFSSILQPLVKSNIAEKTATNFGLYVRNWKYKFYVETAGVTTRNVAFS